MNRVELCAARLSGEEGRKSYAYNDATGKRMTCQPGGNLSIAVGVNLETGLDAEEIDWLTAHRLGKADKALSVYSWYSGADEVRGSVLLDVGFNDGVRGLLHFPHMLAAAALKNWDEAANQLLDSEAARADPHRYQPLAEILRTGVA